MTDIQLKDEVMTDFSGQWTRHIVTEIKHGQVSQTGTLVKVTPLVPKSDGGWIDAGWFNPLPPPLEAS